MILYSDMNKFNIICLEIFKNYIMFILLFFFKGIIFFLIKKFFFGIILDIKLGYFKF